MINKYLTTLTIIRSIGRFLNYYIATMSTFFYVLIFLILPKRVTTSKIEISTFDVVIILNAIGKFRTSKWCFSWIFKEFISMFWIYLWRHKRSERRKSPNLIIIKKHFDVLNLPMASQKIRTSKVLFSTFWSS